MGNPVSHLRSGQNCARITTIAGTHPLGRGPLLCWVGDALWLPLLTQKPGLPRLPIP